MSDDAAHEQFVAIGFASNGGAAYCPKCECTAVYTYAARRIWKCQPCHHQFSVTSGTIFASHKLLVRDYLAAIAIFCERRQRRVGAAIGPRSGRAAQDRFRACS